MSTYTKHVKYKSFEFEVDYHHTPAEPMTMDYPGCPAEIYLEDVRLEGKSIIDVLNAKAEDDLLDLAMLP